MRSLVLVAIVACAHPPEPQPVQPALRHPPEGKLPSATLACELVDTGVRCHATNPYDTAAVACVDTYLGVRLTGVMYAKPSRTCNPVPAGASVEFDAPVGVAPRDVCAPSLDACRLLVSPDEDPGATRAIAFARELAAGATEQGERPTWTECDTTRKELLANGRFPSLRKYIEVEALSLYCMGFTRQQFDCARDAKAESELEHCR